ncbi:RHS repeat-associated core domain-containing protein [Burkholderia ubonensis]|uniref:RHS repeat-associated core domain-containing protein n=1 Tax=Burkholderia ubonensis TaxID=101571 RepID=UPI000753AE92|nr:RHS repeat-associated core domain-containing protein [Burkholderia ubonensis]AOI68875.1 hypothetical protein WI31_04525 [Burkholderia ubonensis]KUZ15887.1 hypothetical protein WI29_18855 [Burkholderia ubonensis]KUZ24596.1 hypothetical protein WI30_29230 [Burkholderia ubonensis]KUZ38424.1 hypothetical protein WI32_12255 [Burkholderia ubonensis]KUZ46212.1 hypothetical protein WI33_24755 [Burkholderia ubonensis]
MDSSQNLAFGTPTLTVLSNRGALARTLTYNRQVANAALDERIERTVHSPTGFAASRIDARLFSAGGTPNFAYVTSLTGRVLRTDGVDAGVTVTLADVDGRPVWAHDARGTTAEWTYDRLGRPLSAQEANGSPTPETRDRWIYGETEPDAQAHNLRGQCVRRYDTAGRLASSDFTLNGQPLDLTRRLLADPEATSNWNGDNEAAWVAALDVAAYATDWTYGATDAWLSQTDAKNNVQVRAFDVTGRLTNSSLKLAGGDLQPVLSAIDYSAAGQVLSETAGNGVIARCEYEPETQRLIRLSATRPTQASRPRVLQDLHYQYDPVGNVVHVRDDAQAITYWRNQKIEPTRMYTFDALYQLMSATGREMVNRGQQGTELPKPIIPLPKDDSIYTNYTRAYAYDRGGNLTQIKHRGAVNYVQEIIVSDRSNHALQQNAAGTITSASVDDGTWFDQSGNQRMLLPDRLQPLVWNERNRLASVTLVPRASQPDCESYQYGAGGMRVRKRSIVQTSGTTRSVEAIYLPGLTLRTTCSDDGQTVKVVEALQEVKVDGGRASVRTLHWENGQPPGIANDMAHYGICDLIDSIGLELDGQAELISREEYYPYGGTAVWTARSAVEADTKYVRYSGKERDATGLYDYGWRSYQPWLGRWLNPDPAGTIDGLNLFRMVRNNPVKYQDSDGAMITGDEARKEVKRKFVLESHMQAMERASTELNAAFSFREAGEYTIDALSRGFAAKGHNILEKTIKPSSVSANYGAESAGVMDIVNQIGLAGVVGKWEGGRIAGVYAHDWSSGMDTTIPLSLEQPHTLEKYNELVQDRKMTPYTGDYDMHDIIFLDSSRSPTGVVPVADSKLETSVKNKINKTVAMYDSSRPYECEPLNVIRHGPQVSFASHMLVHEYEDVEKNKGFLTVVAEPGPFPVAFVNKKEWTVVEGRQELFSYYKNLGTPIPSYWKDYGEKKLIPGKNKWYSTTAKLDFWFR